MILWRYLCVFSICSGSALAAPSDFHGNENEEGDSRTDGGTNSVRLSRQKVRRSIPTEDRRYIEIAIFIDNSLHTQLDESIDVNIKTVVNNVDRLYSSKLNVNIQLVTMDIWETKDQITITDSMKETFQGFRDFNTRTLSSTFSHDSAYLLSGNTFTDSASSHGVSSFRALCSRQGSAGVIQVQDRFNVSFVSAVLARLIGVSLGMPTDTSSCSCSSGDTCVMKSSNSQTPADFSQCSIDAFNSFVQSGRGWCLRELSTQISDSPFCGNGVVEENEQCDCGSEEECAQTSCCINCTLVPGAQCSGGRCCKANCQFHSTRTMCREADGDCDIPEFCTGENSQCPENAIFLDGQSCNDKKGVCVSGSCLSRSLQCAYLWGDGAKESEQECYPNKDNDSNSRFCQHLYCDVSLAPKTQVIMETANVSFIDSRDACSAASVVLDDGTDLGLVFEGSSCFTQGDMCFQQQCTDPSSALPDNCPNHCSSNGVCNSQYSCVCFCGWDGAACNESQAHDGALDLLTGNGCQLLSTHKPKTKPTVTRIFVPDPPVPPETSKDPATFMSSAIIGGSVAIIFVVAVIFGATSIGFRVKRSRMRRMHRLNVLSIFQPTPKQKQKLNKMENDRIMKTKRLKEKLEAQKKARKSGVSKGSSAGACCSDGRYEVTGRLPKDRTTDRLLIDMETEYRPASRTSNETVM